MRLLSKHDRPSSWLVRNIGINVDEYVDNASLGSAMSGIPVPAAVSDDGVTNFRE